MTPLTSIKPRLSFRDAVVLDRLQQQPGLTLREVSRKAGISRNAAHEACASLANAGLIGCRKRAWGNGAPLEWTATELADRAFPPRRS